MAPRKPKGARSAPPLPSLVLATLRKARGWTGQDLAEASGTSAQMISLYEAGRRPPSRERLKALAAAMGYGAEAIDLVLLALKGTSGAADIPGSPVDPTPRELREIRQLAAQVGVAAVDVTEQHLIQAVRDRRVRKARREAARLWAQLRSETSANRRLLVEKAREYQTWGLAEKLCHESAEAASDRVDRALELAELAHRVAELAPGESAWRSRLRGYTLAFLANARRVACDLPGAEAALVQAWKLWNAGVEADPGLLGAWRLRDLEASLRRDQRRFPEALAALERARAEAPPETVARILVNKASIFDQMGDAEESIQAIREASPLVDERREPRLLFGLRFILSANLCHLGRYQEAELELPGVRALAVALRRELDLVRVTWLEGKLAAGLGRRTAARAAFEQARREFTARGMAYDCALVTLELAELDLREGRTGEVRALAEEMAWVFRAQGIHREALAALQLFSETARTEAATVELARRVVQYLYRAQQDPDLRFEA